jgi:dihydrofolate synthase/folylpolyglutamate synthase
MELLPKTATYYFTKAASKRGMPEQSLQVLGEQIGLHGNGYPSVKEAFAAALKTAGTDDFIFVGGSNYVVAEFLKSCI